MTLENLSIVYSFQWLHTFTPLGNINSIIYIFESYPPALLHFIVPVICPNWSHSGATLTWSDQGKINDKKHDISSVREGSFDDCSELELFSEDIVFKNAQRINVNDCTESADSFVALVEILFERSVLSK